MTWVPHAAGPHFLRAVNDEPRPIVFFSGNMHANYPLRRTAREVALRRPELARIQWHPDYGWNFDSGLRSCRRRVRRDGPRLCRRVHRCGVVPFFWSRSISRSPRPARFIADRAVAPQLAKLGFEDGVHYLAADAGDLEAAFERAVDPANFARIDAIRRRGHALVHDRHTFADRAFQVDAACV